MAIDRDPQRGQTSWILTSGSDPSIRGYRSAATPLVLASAFGFLGLVGGTLWGFSIQGTFLKTNIYALTLGTFCAGIAWVLGAALGVYRVRGVPAPTAAGAWALRVAAILFVVAAILVARRYAVPVNFLPGDPDLLSDARWVARFLHELEHELEPLRRLMWLDGVIAALTCIALSVRNRLRRSAMLVGAIAVLFVLCLAAVEFSYALPAWGSA